MSEARHSAPGPTEPTIAVVGSGPSGCYVGQFLAKAWPDAEITVFEALPTPYGLIRYGVAADHQGVKAVTRQFDRLFTRGGVRFVGNVSVGRDIAFGQIAEAFDIVVLATGLPSDQALGIPQDSAGKVVGAGTLLRALNGFPVPILPRDSTGAFASLGHQLVVVGMGNVAVDVVRLLCKGPDGLTGSDIDDDLLRHLCPAMPRTIDVLSRSTAPNAKFDVAMMRELLALPNIDVSVTGLGSHDGGPAAELLRPFARGGACTDSARPQSVRVRLHFGSSPCSIERRNGATTVFTSRRDCRDQSEFAADTVITAIGFSSGVADDQASPTEAWSGPHVYRVGWLSRGAKGTIAENRKDAQRVAGAIVADVASGRITPCRPGFRALERSLPGQTIDFAGWQRIERHERGAAAVDRCRRKITDIDTMLSVAARTHSSVAPLSIAACDNNPAGLARTQRTNDRKAHA
jgi:ferredoxin--NADP+ reductase